MSLLYTNPEALSKCSVRKENDFYPTPWELVKATISTFSEDLDPKTALDIGCGDGIYCKAVKERWPNCHTVGYDVVDRNPSYVDEFILENYLDSDTNYFKYDLIVGNIPYGIAEELLTKAYQELAPNGIMQELLLLNFLGSQGRSPYPPIKKSRRPYTAFFGEIPLYKVMVCSRRPSFTGNGNTDAREYANFFWKRGYAGPAILDWMQW